jgi:ElaB/YqjD/DUF883 family membrane-anchored ribosome-binding protein
MKKENAMNDTKSSIQSKGSLLARDFQNVATDAEELLRAIGKEGDAKLVEVKSQVRSSLEETLKRLEALQSSIATGAKSAARSTDEYVRDNPWGAIGVGAAVGIFAGYLLARR